MTLKNKKQKAWVVAVDMGYGHQRAAFPLKKIAYKNQIVNANNYRGISRKDRLTWKNSRKVYEYFSRFKRVPLVGEFVWRGFDYFQKIQPFYPKRDLSKPTIQLKSTYTLIKKKEWGKGLIDKLSKNPLPFVTTFFIPAFMAEEFNYPGEIYCLATDTDISRAWAPLNPRESRINYLAPTYRVAERLKLYGVREEKIFLTGFPLPEENTGGLDLDVVKKDLLARLRRLDPNCHYFKKYKGLLKKTFGSSYCEFKEGNNGPITLTFAVGGAGAQRDLGIKIVKSLKQRIKEGRVRINLVAGIHNDVRIYFQKELRKIGLCKEVGKCIKILAAQNKKDYFEKFNKFLRNTDLIWTKPSELSFYSGLGIPIIMAPPIGSQEKFNKIWLQTIAAGIPQEDPRYANQWLFDWLESGWFAEAAMQGFLEAGKFGLYNIEKIISHKYKEVKEVGSILQY